MEFGSMRYLSARGEQEDLRRGSAPVVDLALEVLLGFCLFAFVTCIMIAAASLL
jgi:hypothetical protein